MFPSSSSSEREKAGEAAEMAVGWGADKAAGETNAAKSIASTNGADAGEGETNAAETAEGLIFFPCSGGPHQSS